MIVKVIKFENTGRYDLGFGAFTKYSITEKAINSDAELNTDPNIVICPAEYFKSEFFAAPVSAMQGDPNANFHNFQAGLAAVEGFKPAKNMRDTSDYKSAVAVRRGRI